MSAGPTGAVNRGQLRRRQWGHRGLLAVGVFASIWANYHAAGAASAAKVIAAWAPVAFLLSLDSVIRVPIRRRRRAAPRLFVTLGIAGIAAWVSYWHMVEVGRKFGEDGYGAPYLLPLTVDGLIFVATVALFELADQVRKVDADGHHDQGDRVSDRQPGERGDHAVGGDVPPRAGRATEPVALAPGLGAGAVGVGGEPDLVAVPGGLTPDAVTGSTATGEEVEPASSPGLTVAPDSPARVPDFVPTGPPESEREPAPEKLVPARPPEIPATQKRGRGRPPAPENAAAEKEIRDLVAAGGPVPTAAMIATTYAKSENWASARIRAALENGRVTTP